MIRYPSSQLGEMSLEEHSQCECRCQPGPTSELPETRLGGCWAWWYTAVGTRFLRAEPGVWGERVGCSDFLIFLLLVSVGLSYFSDQKKKRVL